MASIARPLSGRIAEREVLVRAATSDRSELIAVYGRRRVGKTFLVRQVFQDVRVAYFEMVGRHEGTTEDHLRLFAESLSAAFHRGASLRVPLDWHEAFRLLEQAIERSKPRKAQKQKTVLFFDEVPWIATHRSYFLAELEHFWNAWCSRRDDIVVVVCGSAASWMLRNIVHARGGLHNRLTQSVRLLPFTLGETRTFFRDRKMTLTDRQIVELYMVFGGVPHYLDHVVRGQSVPQLVDRICFRKDGALADELDRLFASLFGADKKYVDVLRALSKKRRGLSRGEISKAIHSPSGGGLSTILDNLEQAGFISAAIPFGRRARDIFFRLTDEFTLFHLKWLSPRRSSSWQHTRGTPAWQAWAGLAFESLVLKHASRVEHALGIWGMRTHTSAWLHAEAQIDLLIDRADDMISVCEVKFSESPFLVTKKYAAELRNKLDVFRRRTRTKKGLQLVLVAPEGLAPSMHARDLIDFVVPLGALFD